MSHAPRTVSRARLVAACFSGILLSAGEAPEWRRYEVYRPVISNATVYPPRSPGFLYNHGAALARFRGRWICLWNANTNIAEAKPGQRIVMATSDDFTSWSEPRVAFSSPEGSVNPVPSTYIQWQPGLIESGGRLIAVWHQIENQADLKSYQAAYVSTLNEPAGRWSNRMLQFEGRMGRCAPITTRSGQSPVIHGLPWRLFFQGPPMTSSKGRLLAPATLIRHEAPPMDLLAVDKQHDFMKINTIDTAVASDDGGETWVVSDGTQVPGAPWAQWEPSLSENPDGSILMIAKNNGVDGFRGFPQPLFSARLTWSLSRDQGTTWTPKQIIPLEAANARMHVLKGPGDRYAMALNDWIPRSGYGNRYNAALFFKRGAGFNFVPGPGFSGAERHNHYPVMQLSGQTLHILYTVGAEKEGGMGIRAATVTPFPDFRRYYAFPRDNLEPPPQGISNAPDLIAGSAYVWHQAVAMDWKGIPCLGISGEGSAGLDLDACDRDAGDEVRVNMDFRLLEGARAVVATVGDRLAFCEIAAVDGRLLLRTKETNADCGAVRQDDWNHLEIGSAGPLTRVSLNGQAPEVAWHRPAGHWVYLGQGFRRSDKELGYAAGRIEPSQRFAIRMDTLQSRVVRPLFRMAPHP